ncbi:MAG: dihydropteroate synthase [Bacteroidales bacterium]|nr:dihydropteroate synthase [Bacteroidales bacterium]MCD8394283.1 dihydropteroate synthase [Bacteroidales bacterium]
MKRFQSFSLNLKGRLTRYERPAVMGIINVTPDSFYAPSRVSPEQVTEQAIKMAKEGADMLDIGACSTRPGASQPSEQEEIDRLIPAIQAIAQALPEMPISVDTYRSCVARGAIQAGAHIINDISAGELDTTMIPTVAELKVPYIAMHMRGTPETMAQMTHYPHGVTTDVIAELSQVARTLALQGVCDVIIDPGFGFAKTVEQNYELMANLEALHMLERPILVGISRKSMLYKPLQSTPEAMLEATTALNAIALQAGASILRVHDVKAAVDAVKVVELVNNALNTKA